jgi:hypothetical protein
VRRGVLTVIAGILAALSFTSPAAAQGDSTKQRPLFTWRDGLLAGGFIVGTVAIRPLDKRTATALQDSMRQRSAVYRCRRPGFERSRCRGP